MRFVEYYHSRDFIFVLTTASLKAFKIPQAAFPQVLLNMEYFSEILSKSNLILQFPTSTFPDSIKFPLTYDLYQRHFKLLALNNGPGDMDHFFKSISKSSEWPY